MFNPDELQKDAAVSNEIKKNTLSLQEVRDLCAELAHQDAMVEEAEGELKAAKEVREKLAFEVIPDALFQIGLKSLTLDDGTEIGVMQLVSAAITEANKPAAHSWLRAEGDGDIIKDEVTVVFGKGEDVFADRLVENIRKMDDITYGALVRQEKVHASTLKAYVKQRIQEGKTVPADIFGLFLGQQAVVKRPKK